jgi:hypothetical protein
MGSYYDVNMIHATYVWVLMILIIGDFIECRYGSKTEMGASTLEVHYIHLLDIHD